VIRFASGNSTDQAGRTISQISPVPVSTGNVGAVGLSNGGNMVAAVASRHGRELDGMLRYIIQWESPVSSQMATVDLGGHKLIDGQQHAVDFDAVNPRYLAYGPLEAAVYTADIRYAPGSPVPVFHDGNGDGIYTLATNPATGQSLPDLDFDGIIELSEDFPLGAYTDGDREVYSRTVTRALQANGAFPGGWPAWILTPTEADAFWDLREAVRLAEGAAAALPALEAMIVAGIRDHVQGRLDKPHIRQAFESWNQLGQWVQINPDPAYLESILPALAGRDDLPHNTPNTPPTDWSLAAGWCYPEDVSPGVACAAAVRQMADRAKMADNRQWVHTTYVPFIAAGYGWETTLEALNTTSMEQAIRIEYLGSTNGTTLLRAIPPRSLLRVGLDGGNCARVAASTTGLVLAANYCLPASEANLSVPLSQRTTDEATVLMPVAASPTWSGIGIMNASSDENRIRLDVVSVNGWILDSQVLQLPGYNGFSAMFDTLFEVSPNEGAHIQVTGTGILSAMAITGLADGRIVNSPPLSEPAPTSVGIPVPGPDFLDNLLVFENPHRVEVPVSISLLSGGSAGPPLMVGVAPGSRAVLDLRSIPGTAGAMVGLAVRFGDRAVFVRLAGAAAGPDGEVLLTGKTSHRLALPVGAGEPVLANLAGITQRILLTALAEDGQVWTAQAKLEPYATTQLAVHSLFPAIPADSPIRLLVTGQGGLSALVWDEATPENWAAAETLPQTPVYLTDPIVQAYLRESPELLERLRTSPQAVVSYHLRPPSPYYWNFDFLGLADLAGPDLAALLTDYETHALDLASGTPGGSPGGYDYLARLVGYAPPVVSGFSQGGPVGETLLDLYYDLGAGLYVVHGRVVEPGETAGPLFIRPEHVEMKLYEHPEREAAAWIRQELEPWRGEEPVYLNIKVHENNFYLWGTSWDPIFYSPGGPLEPPFDLTAGEGLLRYRSESEQAAQWANYEAAVAFVGANRYSYHAADCREVLEALSTQGSPSPF